jgi:outer membrane protein OmpA-like peptidoglycan-associated protein
MKTARLSALALVACSIAAPALAQSAQTPPGWYLDGGVGANFTSDSTASTAAGNRTATFDTGYSALAGGGYAFGNGLRAEGEVLYSRAGVDQMKGSTGSSGSLSNTDFFVNGLYDIDLDKIGVGQYVSHQMWYPYVGVGVGAGLPETGHAGILANGGSFNDEDLQFAYQAIAGVAVQMDANWAVTADYRYVATTDATFKTTAGGTGTMENASHNIMLGVRYSFGQPTQIMHASAPAPQYKGAKAKKPAPVGDDYMVFFDFNKSVLTAEAEEIVSKVAEDYKSGKYTSIAVTGHTDTVGTEAYNKKLSVRRAAAVKKQLETLGVPAKAIIAKGVGKEGLMVPTADGVREAQNRRAEIDFASKGK